ncbi:MAG: phosphate regulon sensor histidine kinase PhoR [Limnobacter sp.]|nr:phosphate regulon sensor histidine kinase PhoR [Limnobacter sp.]
MLTLLFQLSIHAALLLLAAVVGSAVGDGPGSWLGLLFMALLLKGLDLVNRHKFHLWLDDFTLENVPLLAGVWDDMAAKLFRVLKLQQKQQQALSNALISFRTAAQALPDGVVTLDAAGHIIWCNSTAQKHLGLRLTSDIGFPLINIVRDPQFVHYLSGNAWEQTLVIHSPRSNGKILSVQAVGYGDQQVLVLSRDITKIERLEAMRRDFIANVSHELKTPLTVLSGFLETFRDMPLSPEQRTQYLEMMANQAVRMQNLVEDLLTLSALESGTQAESETVNLSELALHLANEAQQISGGQHRIVAEQIEHNLLAQGSEQEIRSAFSNLVTNAVRYTPQGGTIRLTLQQGEDDLGQPISSFTVTDSGIGIQPEHIPRLTERFYRVDRSRSRESGGTGLGLAIVKHITSRHHGELKIRSTPGTGSTFEIQLPLAGVDHPI